MWLIVHRRNIPTYIISHLFFVFCPIRKVMYWYKCHKWYECVIYLVSGLHMLQVELKITSGVKFEISLHYKMKKKNCFVILYNCVTFIQKVYFIYIYICLFYINHKHWGLSSLINVAIISCVVIFLLHVSRVILVIIYFGNYLFWY